MKYLTTTLLLLAGLCGFAQTAPIKFVEVHVTDTVWVKMQSFDFQVTVSDPDYSYDDYYYTDSMATTDYAQYEKDQKLKNDKEREKRLKELHKALTKSKFDPKPIQPRLVTYIMPDSFEPYGYIVTIKTPAEAQRLREAVKDLDYAMASASNIKFSALNAYEDQLMKKLMAHARKKAEVIATAGGKKLGEVLEVYENGSYDNFSNYPDEETSYTPALLMMREWEKSMSVKFALE